VHAAAKAAVFVDARGAERAAAGAGSDLAELEMTEELGPFLVGDPRYSSLGRKDRRRARNARWAWIASSGYTALYPMVTFRSRWPAMIWAMWGGRPLLMASVMKIRRKSWGL
jgi:hypothetical protein